MLLMIARSCFSLPLPFFLSRFRMETFRKVTHRLIFLNSMSQFSKCILRLIVVREKNIQDIPLSSYVVQLYGGKSSNQDLRS